MTARFLRRIVTMARSFAAGTPSSDGFGQTLAQDMRYLSRFRRCRRMAVEWRLPTHEERKALDSHAVIGRFGDDTIAVAKVGAQDWVVRDRMWHGWPDPPEFVFFAMEDETVWAAADFDYWPRHWGHPAVPCQPTSNEEG